MRQDFKDALVKYAMSRHFTYKTKDTRKTKVKTICKEENCTRIIIARGDIEFTVTKYLEDYRAVLA